MFGYQPPQLTDEELREAETIASMTIQQFAIAGVVLYLCMFLRPQQLWAQILHWRIVDHHVCPPAPFVIDVVSKVF
ncbi:uncharacterized protein BCR38DRAFT_483402 [Pseudomassariella vexata]|uniref:Uncharacterized protein n=1 Tax=Pseudomassariella vexata TaxID=1141098 RepID=A0A1Y2E943_9PEZI|nr:uncharacterized protein BCR38DRAFT_483402 [Pseudomassariella vexata]ORY67796.1 hypothetical protein BCR38DRAFT_483402 [Pseudomassariella vexata]